MNCDIKWNDFELRPKVDSVINRLKRNACIGSKNWIWKQQLNAMFLKTSKQTCSISCFLLAIKNKFSCGPPDWTNSHFLYRFLDGKNTILWQNWKIVKMALLNLCMNFKKKFCQKHSFEALWKWQQEKIFTTCPRVRQIQDLCRNCTERGFSKKGLARIKSFFLF